jgi:hypothetical protein
MDLNGRAMPVSEQRCGGLVRQVGTASRDANSLEAFA